MCLSYPNLHPNLNPNLNFFPSSEPDKSFPWHDFVPAIPHPFQVDLESFISEQDKAAFIEASAPRPPLGRNASLAEINQVAPKLPQAHALIRLLNIDLHEEKGMSKRKSSNLIGHLQQVLELWKTAEQDFKQAVAVKDKVEEKLRRAEGHIEQLELGKKRGVAEQEAILRHMREERERAEKRLAAEFEAVKKQITEAHQKELAQLKAEHAARMELQKKLECAGKEMIRAQQKVVREQLEDEYEREIQENNEEHEREIQEIQKAHQRVLDGVNQGLQENQQELDEELQRLKEAHLKELDVVKQDFQDNEHKYEQEIKELREAHQKELDAVKQDFQEDEKERKQVLQGLQEAHQKELDGVKQDLQRQKEHSARLVNVITVYKENDTKNDQKFNQEKQLLVQQVSEISTKHHDAMGATRRLSQALARVTDDHTAELQKIREAHIYELEGLRKEAVGVQEKERQNQEQIVCLTKTCEELETGLSRAREIRQMETAEFERKEEECRKEIDSLQETCKELREAVVQVTNNHMADLKKVREEHVHQLQELREKEAAEAQGNEKEYQRQFGSLQETCEGLRTALIQSASNHTEDLQKIQDTHTQKFTELQELRQKEALEAQEKDEWNQKHIVTLIKSYDQLKLCLTRNQNSHAVDIQKIREQHAHTLEELRKKDAAETQEKERQTHDQIVSLTESCDRLKAALTRITTMHTEESQRLFDIHARQLRELREKKAVEAQEKEECHRGQIAVLAAACEELKANATRASVDLQNIRNAHADELQNEAVKVQHKKRQSQEQITTLAETCKELRTALDELKKTHAEETAAAQRKDEEHARHVEATSISLSKYAQEVKDKNLELAELSAVKQQYEVLKTQYDDLERTNADECAIAKSQAKQHSEYVERKLLLSYNSRLKDLKDDLNDSKAHNKELASKIADAERLSKTESATLEKRITQLQEEYKTLKETSTKVEEMCANTLKDADAHYNVVINSLRLDFDKQKAQLECTWAQKLEDLKAAHATEIGGMRKSLAEENDSQVVKFNQKMQDKEMRIKELNDTHLVILSKLAAAEKHLKDSTEANNLNKQMMEAHLRGFESRVDNFRSRIDTYYEPTLKLLEKERNEALATLAGRDVHVGKLRADLDLAEAERNMWKRQSNAAGEKITMNEAEVQAIEEELATAMVDLEDEFELVETP
jgi:hypothetical protein